MIDITPEEIERLALRSGIGESLEAIRTDAEMVDRTGKSRAYMYELIKKPVEEFSDEELLIACSALVVAIERVEEWEFPARTGFTHDEARKVIADVRGRLAQS